MEGLVPGRAPQDAAQFQYENETRQSIFLFNFSQEHVHLLGDPNCLPLSTYPHLSSNDQESAVSTDLGVTNIF